MNRIGNVITRTLAFVLAVFLFGVLVGKTPEARAEYDSIKHTDPANVIHSQTITAGGTFTQTRAFEALEHTINQSVQVQGTGTAPNYKVEMLVTVDGTNYVKPETGGDVGTFTDQLSHVIAVVVPLSVGHKLKVTELGGANSITIEAWERSQ